MNENEDTYKGESPSKKVARLVYWDQLVDELGDTFFETTHVVLASREGGDISVLLGLGVDPERIVAVDRVASAIEKCATRFRSYPVRFRVGDVADVARTEADVGHVFLDLCSPISRESVRTITSVAAALRVGSVVGVGILRGREHDAKGPFELIAANRRQRMIQRSVMRGKGPGALKRRSAASSELSRALNGDSQWSPRNLLNAVKAEYGDVVGGQGRAAVVGAAINMSMPIGGAPKAVDLIAIIDYVSKTAASKGVPMTYVAYSVNRGGEIVRDERNRLVADGFDDGRRGKYFSIDEDERSIRDRAIAIAADGHDAAALLNIAPATVAAWKAHATRGTYENAS